MWLCVSSSSVGGSAPRSGGAVRETRCDDKCRVEAATAEAPATHPQPVGRSASVRRRRAEVRFVLRRRITNRPRERPANRPTATRILQHQHLAFHAARMPGRREAGSTERVSRREVGRAQQTAMRKPPITSPPLSLLRKKALLTSGDMAGHLCPSAVRTLPLPSPILSPSRFPYSGRYKRGMASELRALQQPGLEY
eukprot:scaffold8542_cov119-Isochrysis_galbana.AAC.10